jgi:SPP1 gp7 family putative phage head morphogenesis protein
VARRKRKQRRGKRPAYPSSQERAYAGKLVAIVDACRKPVRAALARLAKVSRGDAAGFVDGDDDNVKAVTRSFDGVRAQIDTVVRRARPGLIAQGVDARVSAFAIKAVDKSVRGVVAVETSELGVKHKAFVRENVALIKSIGPRLHDAVVDTVEEGWRKGRTTAAIAADVEESFGVSERRARLIARDQVGKLNGDVTKARQKEIGISSYAWSTSMDERVRGNPGGLYPDADPSHWHREGKVFAWDDPPEDGHPGEAIQCRCVAIPIIPDEDADE